MEHAKKHVIRKRVLAILLMISLLFTGTVAQAAGTGNQEVSDNMLADGSFDKAMTVLANANTLSKGYWTSVSWASRLAEPENANTGTGVANLVYDYAGLGSGEYPGFYQDVEVEKNTIYEVSFYVKNWHWDTDAVEHFKYGYRNPYGTDVWASVEEYMAEDVGTEYQKISFQLNSRDLEAVRIFVFATSVKHENATGGYHFDDFTMVKAGKAEVPQIEASQLTYTENLLHDSSFDLGDSKIFSDANAISKLWTIVAQAGVDGGYTHAYTGSSNLYLVYRLNDWVLPEYPSAYQDVEVEANTWYEYSFYAKKWGASTSEDKLYYGFRDPYSTDVWANTQEYITQDISEEYQKVSCKLYTGNRTTIRVFFCVMATDNSHMGDNSGFHIDDVTLSKCAKLWSCDFETSGNITVGEKVSYNVSASFDNGSRDVSIKAGQGVTIRFESSDDSVITGDMQGNLVATGLGTAKVQMIINAYGHEAVSEEKEITVTGTNASVYIQSVNAAVSDTIETGQYYPIGISAEYSDGTSVPTGSVTITVQSSNEAAAYVALIGNEYYLYSVGQGSAVIYVTIDDGDNINIGKLAVDINDGNLLSDSSFEMQNSENAYWTMSGTAGGGVDGSYSNLYAHTGYANLWLMAPVYWDENVANDSSIVISQEVNLKAGLYDMSAYMNRFYANGPDGGMPEYGGTVYLGAVPVDEQGNEIGTGVEAAFGVGYGVDGFEKMKGTLNIESDGQYKVYVKVVGSEVTGLGMQLDDVVLKAAKAAERIEAGLTGDVVVNGVTAIETVVYYEDGTSESLKKGITYTVADENVLYVAGNSAIGCTSGETTITVTAKINGKSFSAKIPVSVSGSSNSITGNTDTGSNLYWIIGIVCAAVVLIGGTGAVYIIRKKKQQ